MRHSRSTKDTWPAPQRANLLGCKYGAESHPLTHTPIQNHILYTPVTSTANLNVFQWKHIPELTLLGADNDSSKELCWPDFTEVKTTSLAHSFCFLMSTDYLHLDAVKGGSKTSFYFVASFYTQLPKKLLFLLAASLRPPSLRTWRRAIL